MVMISESALSGFHFSSQVFLELEGLEKLPVNHDSSGPSEEKQLSKRMGFLLTVRNDDCYWSVR